MGDLSVKGISRRHLGLSGSFSLMPSLLPWVPVVDPEAFPTVSVRTILEAVARREHEYERHEHPYTWEARHQQTWTHIRVRIKLKPKNKDAEDALDGGLRATWKAGIEGAWNGRYWARANGELPCRISFDVVWTDDDPHHTVRVESVDEFTRSDMTHWDTLDSGNTAAHEYGHMIGKFDEYDDAEVPGREHVETGSIMDNKSTSFSPRQFTRFADNLGCFLSSEDGSAVPKPY